MPKFKFICEFDEKTKIEYELNKDYLYDIVEDFESFLKGCGFVFDRITVENEDQGSSFEFEYSGIDETNDLLYMGTDDIIRQEELFDMSDSNERKRYDDRCYLCGIEKNIMKGYACHDVKCPKGTW